ncbi:molybdopterin-binding protein [Dactylosporangium sp. CA-139066]|uniref:molybdopterin-binding protein n=1 Tax=Dactylosporangium sp. CA-139066 TaxID=3239930 RepID=UPI003D9225A3
MTTWSAAHLLASSQPCPLPARTVPLSAATGLVAAADVRAAVPSPAFDSAAMDGYAVAGPGPWVVTGRRLAGSAVACSLGAGTALEIATGATLPAGCEAVVPYEACERDGDLVSAPPPARDHVRRAGEDARPGDVLLPAGRTVTAVAAAALGQAGVEEVLAHPRAALTVLVTGDEVVPRDAPGPLGPGQVRDAFTGVVAAVAARAGAAPPAHRHVPDDRAALAAAIEAAGGDVVAVTGSSSRGAADHLRAVVAGLGGRWPVDGVACRPGHPQGLAALPDGRWLVSLPGNPFAGLVAVLTLLEPLLARLAGRRPGPAPRIPVDGEARPYAAGARLVPVVLEAGRARVVAGSRPAGLRAAAGADALAVLDPGWRPGADALLLPLP